MSIFLSLSISILVYMTNVIRYRDDIGTTKHGLTAKSQFMEFLAQRDETQSWLEHITLIISTSMKIVKLLEKGISVIVHCR